MVTGCEKEKKTVTLAPGWKDTAHHASTEAHRQMAFNWREIPIYWPKVPLETEHKNKKQARGRQRHRRV